MRNSFILHLDSLAILDELTPEQKGNLFQAIYDYQQGKDVQLDAVLKLVFIPFRNQFERDNEKYEKRCEANRANGSKGGKRKVANASKRKRTQTNLADSDSKSDSDSKKEIDIPELSEFGSYALTKIKEILKTDPQKYRSAIHLKYTAWVEAGWKDGNGKPIKNWKSKLLNTIPHMEPRDDNKGLDYSLYLQ